MKRIVLRVVIVLAVLLAALMVAFKIYVTKERVMAWVIPPLEEQLHRKVSLSDVEVGFTSFDLVGLDVRSEGAEKPLTNVERVKVSWKLLPLLSGRLEVGEALLVSPYIRIVRLQDGSLDVDDIGAGGSGDEAVDADKAGTTGDSGGEGGGEQGLAVIVDTVRVTGGRFEFVDNGASPPETYTVSGFDLSVDGFGMDKSWAFSLSALFSGLGDSPLVITGTVDPTPPAGPAVDAVATLKGLALADYNKYMSGGLDFAGGEADLEVSALLVGDTVERLGAELEARAVTLRRAGRSGEPTDVSFSSSLALGDAMKSVEIKNADLAVAGQRVGLVGTVELPQEGGPLKFDLALHSPALDADKLLVLLPPEGNASGGAGDKPAAAKAAGGKAQAPGKLGVEGKCEVKVGKFTAANVKMGYFTSTVRLRGGKVSAEPLAAVFYGGRIEGGATASVEKAGPPFSSNAKVSGVEIAGLIKDLVPDLGMTITGTFDAEAKATGVGGELKRLESALDATLKDGKVKDHPLIASLAKFIGSDEVDAINYYSITSELATANGVATVKKFYLDGHNLRLGSTGTVGLLDHALDLSVTAAVPPEVGERIIKSKEVRKALTGDDDFVSLPLRVSGTLEAPVYGLDERKLDKLAKQAVKKQLEKQVEKNLGEQAPEPIKKLLPKALDNLFGK